MSSFRKIWREAIGAGQEMMLNRKSGEQLFEQLVNQHSQDGMILYERGEAAEYLGDLESAERDYTKAERLLPVEHWKAVARTSVARVQHKRNPKEIGPPAHLQWDAFHDVHAIPRAPHKVRVRALSALTRIDSEEESALTDLRSCLEEVVVDQLRSVPLEEWHQNSNFYNKVSVLQSQRRFPDTVAQDMQRLWKIGNKGAHPDGALKRWESSVSFAYSAISTLSREPAGHLT